MLHQNLTRAGLTGVLLIVAPVLFAQSIRISDATAVRLSLSEALSSATNSVDDPVRFEVTEDVKVGDIVAIPKGSTAVGHVVEVESRKRMGRAGKLNFSIDHVKAADGSNVRLRASTTRKGDDKTGSVIIGTVILSPLFLIMRGKDVEIARGTSLIAYIDGDREIGQQHTSVSLNSSSNSGGADSSSYKPQKVVELATVVIKSVVLQVSSRRRMWEARCPMADHYAATWNSFSMNWI